MQSDLPGFEVLANPKDMERFQASAILALGKKLGRPLSIVEAVAVGAAPAEEVDLEAALGGGIRKAPAAVEALDEAEVAEG